jgi:rod shape-determining protein MreC
MALHDRHAGLEDRRRSRTVAGLLILASVTIVTLDSSSGASPLQPARSAVAAVLGPIEDAASAATRPLTTIPDRFRTVNSLRDENARLAAQNQALSAQLEAAQAAQNRSDEIAGIASTVDASSFDVVAAQVVGIGPAQSFSRTVTIGAGVDQGVVPDLTVINATGLVGRVVSATHDTATVLLIADAKSTVGGRLGASMELGFLDGAGDISGNATLDLSLVDHTVSPRVGDTVVTWGSRNGAPYVAGVPIGTVVSVHSSPAELTQTATVRPFVDFSSLDVVAVVTGVNKGASGAAQPPSSSTSEGSSP